MGLRILSRRHVLILSGLIWSAVAAILLFRAATWLSPEPFLVRAELVAASVAILPFGYKFGLRRAVRRNAERIKALTEPLQPWSVLSGRGLFMIAGMVALGYILRNSPIPKVYLIIPYEVMGGMLLVGAFDLIRPAAPKGPSDENAKST